jgi:3-phytase
MKVLRYIPVLIFAACGPQLPEVAPEVITEKTLHDTDDPAIWVNPKDAAQSLIFGTDKDTNGAIYAFNLDGKIIEDKTIRNVKRPNNVDLEYGFALNDSTQTDIIVFTEREEKRIRMYSVPDMQPLDNGGFPVFTDATGEERLPMGIALYKKPQTGDIYAIVGRKTGPIEGYLYQYQLQSDSTGISAKLVRKFGGFSGKKEIEAIAVDNEKGYVYYSDEGHGIRKYHADPAQGDAEIALFGSEYFKEDIEGIAIARYDDGSGYLYVSNQQRHSFVIFDRNTNAFLDELDLTTVETDGCDVVTVPMEPKFPNGLFVSMSDSQQFYFHDLAKIKPGLYPKPE